MREIYKNAANWNSADNNKLSANALANNNIVKKLKAFDSSITD